MSFRENWKRVQEEEKDYRPYFWENKQGKSRIYVRKTRKYKSDKWDHKINLLKARVSQGKMTRAEVEHLGHYVGIHENYPGGHETVLRHITGNNKQKVKKKLIEWAKNIPNKYQVKVEYPSDGGSLFVQHNKLGEWVSETGKITRIERMDNSNNKDIVKGRDINKGETVVFTVTDHRIGGIWSGGKANIKQKLYLENPSDF